MPFKTVKKSELFSKLIDQLKAREVLDDMKREATNNFNRHNSVCCKSFAAFMAQENLPARTKLIVDGTEYMWATAESRVIDPRQWYEMFKAGELTEKQFFDSLSVSKKEARLLIGEDQVEAISIDKLGTDADIRRDNSNAGVVSGIQVLTPDTVPPKSIKRIATPVQKPAQSGRR